jgi:tRNA(fMet)-specific endonuclease VapC
VKYLFDTNACIALLKGKSLELKERVASIETGEAAVPSVVRYELFYGGRKSDRSDETLMRLHRFLGSFPSVPFDDRSAEICGMIRASLEKVGNPIGPYDLMIAALAIQHDLILVTRNTREFQRVDGIKIENWEG